MALLQRLLLLPLLAPLLAVLLVAAINPRPAIALRLLTWTSPALPIGLWLSLAACGGGALSAGATSLALRSTARAEPKARRSETSRSDQEGWSVWPDAEPTSHGVPQPARAPGEPAPTVAVPFRVIRKGKGTSQDHSPPTDPGRQSEAGRQREPARQPQSEPTVSVGDGWDAVISDDW